ncbi:MAG: LytTR family DNA-binding domain-containing protein [Erythrobacter sp.]
MSLSATQRTLAQIGIVVALGCVVGASGLLYSPAIPLSARIALTVGSFLVGWAMVRGLAIVGEAIARLLGIAPLWGYAFAVPVSGIGIAWFVLWQLGGLDAALSEAFMPIWVRASLIGAFFFALFFVLNRRAARQTAVIETASGVGRNRSQPPLVAPSPPEPEPTSEQGAAQTQLHDRLPRGFPAILALQVEDHYVRAIAAERSEMVLISLSDAIAEMPEDVGEQVHRSWWVARSAVAGHRRVGRDVRLVLINGSEAPVSRVMAPTLRAKGWF